MMTIPTDIAAGFRRAYSDLHYIADLFHGLPLHAQTTPEQLDSLTTQLRPIIGELRILYDNHITTIL
jgi:hypothetical protein